MITFQFHADRSRAGSARRMVVLVLVLVALATGSVAVAQTADTAAPRISYGVFGDYLRSVHSTDFDRFAGQNDFDYISRFDGGRGTGFTLGALFELPLSTAFRLSVRGSYEREEAELRAIERTTVIVRDSMTLDGVFERRINTHANSAVLETGLLSHLPLGLALTAGARLGFVLSTGFETSDVLTEPATEGVFENGRRIRNDSSGAIPNVASLLTSAQLGLSREFPIDHNGAWYLVPEILFSYALTPLTDGMDWKAHGMRLGLALKHSPLPTQLLPPPPPPPPPPPLEPPVLAAEVRAVSVDVDGVERPAVTVRIEEFISTQMRPLLNYVFFDQGSAELPQRYRTLAAADAKSFDVNKLFGTGALETYYDVLNVIGLRMKRTPSARITLTGTNADVGGEAGNTSLSKKRAETVRDYLTGVWGIAEDRIALQARDLPEVPSDTTHAESAEENRRVEISSNDHTILDAVFSDDTVRTVSPPLVRFYPMVRSGAGAESWDLTARQGMDTVAMFSGNGSVPPVIEWKPSSSAVFEPGSTEPVSYSLKVRDVARQQTETEPQRIMIEQVTLRSKREDTTADRRTDRYGLILFGYNRSDLSAVNLRIAAMIRSRIPSGSAVTITAHTDRTGEADRNQKLSEERALVTARALGVDPSNATGVGETRALFDNELPEGRFYNRTVEVVVESVVK